MPNFQQWRNPLSVLTVLRQLPYIYWHTCCDVIACTCVYACFILVPPCGGLGMPVQMLAVSQCQNWWHRYIFIYMPCPSAETWWCGNICSQMCHVSPPPHGGLACLLGCLPCSCSATCPSGHARLPAVSHDGMGRTIYILSLSQG